jgi:hypothetical protein
MMKCTVVLPIAQGLLAVAWCWWLADATAVLRPYCGVAGVMIIPPWHLKYLVVAVEVLLLRQ